MASSDQKFDGAEGDKKEIKEAQDDTHFNNKVMSLSPVYHILYRERNANYIMVVIIIEIFV